MSTYWPGQTPVTRNMVRLCRFCGFHEHVAEQFVNGCEQNPDGHEYVEVNGAQVGPVGPGTAASRMHWLWEQLHEYEGWLAEHGDYNPVSSLRTGMIEVCLVRALAKVARLEGKQ